MPVLACEIQLARYRLRFRDTAHIVPCLQAFRDVRAAHGPEAARQALPTLAARHGGTISALPEPPDWLEAYDHIDAIERYLRGLIGQGGPDPARAMHAVMLLREDMTELLEGAI